MNLRAVSQIVGVGTLLLTILIANLIGVFFLTAWLYHIIGYTPRLLLVQLINSLLGALLYVLMVVGFFSFINSRSQAQRGRMGILEPIFKAMEQIARGDFQVRLNPTQGANTFVN